MDIGKLRDTLLENCGIRATHMKYVYPPAIAYGVLEGEVVGKANWKKFVRYLVTANPDLFHYVFGYLGTFDKYASELSSGLRLTFGLGSRPYSLTTRDGDEVFDLPVPSLRSRHVGCFTLGNLRTAIDRLLVMVRKATTPVVASFSCVDFPELPDNQLLSDMRSQCRAYSALCRAPQLFIHNGELVYLRITHHDVRMVLAGLQLAYPGEFDEGIRLLDGGSAIPAWALYAGVEVMPGFEDGLRFADYNECMKSNGSELQFLAQQAVLRAGGCSPENICAKTIDLINTLIKQEN